MAPCGRHNLPQGWVPGARVRVLRDARRVLTPASVYTVERRNWLNPGLGEHHGYPLATPCAWGRVARPRTATVSFRAPGAKKKGISLTLVSTQCAWRTMPLVVPSRALYGPWWVARSRPSGLRAGRGNRPAGLSGRSITRLPPRGLEPMPRGFGSMVCGLQNNREDKGLSGRRAGFRVRLVGQWPHPKASARIRSLCG